MKSLKDEKTCQSYPNGRVYIWRYAGERFDPNLVEDKSTSGRFSCNFHGFISRRGLEELTLIEGYLNSEKYCEILENTVFPAMNYLQPHFMPYFMHDRYSYTKYFLELRFLNNSFEFLIYKEVLFILQTIPKNSLIIIVPLIKFIGHQKGRT